MSIHISIDSTITLPKDQLEKFSISVMPMHIVFSGESFDDSVNIDAKGLIERYQQTGEIPSTSACSIGEYQDLFSRLTADGSEVIHFCMASEMSSTYQNAKAAAADFPSVSVVDTHNITSATGLMVLKAAELRNDGYSVREILRRVDEMIGKVRSSFILENLSFLAKNGRCPSVVAFGANVLGIKPSIVVENGKMSVGKKYRGKFDACIMKYIRDLLENNDKIDLSRVSVEYAYGITDAQIDMIKKEVRKYQKFDETLTVYTSSTITAHCGQGVIGVLFLEK